MAFNLIIKDSFNFDNFSPGLEQKARTVHYTLYLKLICALLSHKKLRYIRVSFLSLFLFFRP